MTISGLAQGQNGTAHLNVLLPSTGTPVNMVASAGTLTIAEPVTAGDTMTIGSQVYTFVADGTATDTGDLDLGADEAATKLNIVKAILGTDGVNNANASVTCAAAFSTDDLLITAKFGGASGDLIATTETFTHASNIFDDATLGTTTAGAGSPAVAGQQYIDDTNIYFCTAASATATVWRKIAHSAI